MARQLKHLKFPKHFLSDNKIQNAPFLKQSLSSICNKQPSAKKKEHSTLDVLHRCPLFAVGKLLAGVTLLWATAYADAAFLPRRPDASHQIRVYRRKLHDSTLNFNVERSRRKTVQ